MTKKRYLDSNSALINFINNKRFILDILINDEYEKLKDNDINNHFCKLKKIKSIAIAVYCFSFMVIFIILYYMDKQ